MSRVLGLDPKPGWMLLARSLLDRTDQRSDAGSEGSEVVLREPRNPWISSAYPHSRAQTPELLTRGSRANADIICSREPTWGMGFTNEKCPIFLRIDFDHQHGSYAWRWGSH
jgi:hypothetical protein